jgi:hypothetical protein
MLPNVSVWAKSPTDMLYFTSVEATWENECNEWIAHTVLDEGERGE